MSNPSLSGLCALVTGAAQGIGRAIAARLARDGADVALFDLSGVSLDATCADVLAAGRRAWLLPGDVTHEADWARAIAAVIDAAGRLDILVNNAGIAGPLAPLVDYDVMAFDRVMAVNVRGVFLGMQHAARAMRDAGRGGAIVNIASVSGLSGSRNIIAYTASKHAVIGMTKNAALELAAHKIRVNAVCPAPTATEMIAQLERTLAPDNPEAVRKRFHDSIPLGRYGEPGEIAAAVAYLAGPESAFITGAALTIDGGMLAS
jgi:NAD(P)-dependent dehydrogenase (short-subunit alcohol dehydrogenase family)